MLVRLFPGTSILSGEKMIRKAPVQKKSLDFTTEIKGLHCFGSVTYKNSRKFDKYRRKWLKWIAKITIIIRNGQHRPHR